MEKRKDYYKILGVPRDATVGVIKRAFRRLAGKNPPRSSGPGGEWMLRRRNWFSLQPKPPELRCLYRRARRLRLRRNSKSNR